ncbi:nucleotide sugar dehydrogenase [Vulgatibacter incomptus]|uniref:UDP-glucose dehydrogenase n=1 Tax=Vulgatibacter incomptus TaxID=1391653 RepID=A0A0K1PAW9_9BACT|nr:nucleotide sugar dehydrogenase [Vulgatibacter incomptus]AKU90670.1 UDP-glucose dehydrogenase [Vulgatibacter incomptus]
MREFTQTQELLEKIALRQAKVGIVGLGYVGLPLGLAFADGGFPTLGLDVDGRKVETISKGKSYIRHIPEESVARLTAAGKLEATVDFSQAASCDALILCVPTPLGPSREPDLSFIEAAGRSIAPHLRPGQLVVLESSTYPGTTDEVLRPILEKESGLVAGRDFHLAFSPEREDPANGKFTTSTIPKLVGGHTPACLDAAMALYGSVIERVVPVSSTRVAELAKLLENIFRCVNIALVNELKMLCDRMGLDVWEVIDAAATKPFGFMPFYPGPGLGGHCIPVDPFYLTWKARHFEFATRFIELAGEINTNMPYYVVQRTVDALNAEGKSVRGARILALGVAYKKDVDDLRESPALRVMELLEAKGARIEYHDPYVGEARSLHDPSHVFRSVPLTKETIVGADAVIVLTDHGCIDYAKVVADARLVIDTRNATRAVVQGRDKVVKA